jgi:hypothetical protein
MFQIVLQGSHWTSLIVGACNIDPKNLWAKTSLSGWETGLDGGQNTHNPNEYAVLLAKAGWMEGEGVEEVLIMRVHERFAQDANDSNGVTVYRHRRPTELKEVPFWEEGYFDRPSEDRQSYVPGLVEDSDWERLDAPPQTEYNIMMRVVERIRALYGQGNYDSLFGEKSPAEAGDYVVEKVSHDNNWLGDEDESDV